VRLGSVTRIPVAALLRLAGLEHEDTPDSSEARAGTRATASTPTPTKAIGPSNVDPPAA
jgi:hypothetical protein